MPLRGPRHWSRETRLLLLTIAVSVTVLLVLARFRFPDERRAAPPPQPLERLAARATYDELAADVARLQRRLAPSVLVLEARDTRPAAPRTLAQLFERRMGDAPTVRFIPALRIRDDIAAAVLDHGTAIQGLVGQSDAVPLVLAVDPLRRLAVVRVPPPADAWALPPLASLTTPRYVVAAEGTRGGAAMRPVFVGGAGRLEDPRWAGELAAADGLPLAADGALAFSLDGELAGLVIDHGAGSAIVPPAVLDAAVNTLLADGSPRSVDFGVTLAPLTGADVKTLDVTAGLFVQRVEPRSLADGHLQAGDLLLAIDSRAAVDAETVLVSLARTRPGTTVRFHVLRKAQTLDVEIATPAEAPAGTGR